jgi:hypothetical protein
MSDTSAAMVRDDEEPKKIFGLVTGTVGPMPDPLMQGRVQVILHFLDSADFSAFARVAAMVAGPLMGSYFVPMPGDEVVVAFEHGDVNSPYVLGSLWNATRPPPVPTQLSMIKALRTLTGNQIVFTDGPPSIALNVASPAAVPAAPTGVANLLMTPAGVQIVVPGSSISITPGGIVLQSGANTLSLTSAGVLIQSTAPVVVQGSVVMLNP